MLSEHVELLLTEKLLFQKSSMVFCTTLADPPPLWKKTILDPFFAPFPKIGACSPPVGRIHDQLFTLLHHHHLLKENPKVVFDVQRTTLGREGEVS